MTEIAGIGSAMAILLACVLIVAAATKLSARQQTVQEFELLMVPMPKVLALLVPLLELMAASALIIRPRVGSLASGALLLVFTIFLAMAVRSGRTVNCGCLGALSRQPVTMATVARNLGLVAMAGSATAVPDNLQVDLISMMVSLSILLMVAVVGQLVVLRKQIGRIWSVELAGEQADTGRMKPSPSPGDLKGITV